MDQNQVLHNLFDKYGEYIEQASPYEDLLVISILCQIIVKDKDQIDFLKNKISYLEQRLKSGTAFI